MLPAGSPENTQNMIFRVEPTGLGEGTDRPAHCLVRHTDKAQGYIINCAVFLYTLRLVGRIDFIC
jgi:hypothetical protein